MVSVEEMIIGMLGGGPASAEFSCPNLEPGPGVASTAQELQSGRDCEQHK